MYHRGTISTGGSLPPSTPAGLANPPLFHLVYLTEIRTLQQNISNRKRTTDHDWLGHRAGKDQGRYALHHALCENRRRFSLLQFQEHWLVPYLWRVLATKRS